MGIPSYFSHIIRNYPGIQIVNPFIQKGTCCHHFFMDCNSIIYDVYHTIINTGDPKLASMTYAEMESLLIHGIIEKIIKYVKIVNPVKTVFVAFDGVAPFAKMEQQRTRRYRSWFTETLFAKIPGAVSKTCSTYPIYSGMFTPGTPFMMKLSKDISDFFGKSSNVVSFGGNQQVQFMVSAADQVGEGEHKLFVYLREMDTMTRKNETVALYGLDADLIMLSIFHCNLCQNIYIMREMPAYEKKDNSKNKSELTYVDIKGLCRGIVKELCGILDPNVLYIYDYVFLCFFLGNDFLPHFPALNIRTSGIGSLMDAYRKVLYSKRLHIINEDGNGELSIRWNHLGLLIDELGRVEHILIQTENRLRDKMSGKISKTVPNNPSEREDYINNIPLMYRCEEGYICPDEMYWQQRYYSSLFSGTPEVAAICKNFLEGLEWVFHYYTSGCIHWRWKYQYSYPPLLTDLKRFLLPDISPMSDFCKETSLKNVAFHPEMQLAYVFPRAYLGLLSPETQDFLQDKMKDYYPQTAEEGGITFKWAFCRYFWEAHVLLPEIPLEEWAVSTKKERI